MDEIETITLEPKTVFGLREHVQVDGMRDFFARALGQAYQALQRAHVAPSGPPMAVYRGDATNGFDVVAGFPIASTMRTESPMEEMALPTGTAAPLIHTGSYDSMTQSYDRLTRWMESEHLRPGELMWEEYLTDPGTSPDPDTWKTRIVWPFDDSVGARTPS